MAYVDFVLGARAPLIAAKAELTRGGEAPQQVFGDDELQKACPM